MKKIILIIILVSLLAVSLTGLTTNYEADEKQIYNNLEISPTTNICEDTSNFFSFEGKVYYLPNFPEKSQKQLDKMIKDPKPTMAFGDLPSQFSWLDYGGDWSTPAKDQGNCGSCWAFGALGAMEAAINIAKGDPDFDCNLSEQYVLSCLSAAGSCGGGWMSEAIEYIESTAPGSSGNGINGCPLESCLPYQAKDNIPCDDKCDDWDYHSVPPEEDNILFQVEDFGVASINPSSSSDWDILKTWVYTYGPIVVDIYASDGWATFGFSHNLPSDVYEGTESGTTNHAQVLCGWVDDDSILNGGYWILKNSWGTGFGYAGFINVAYGCLRLGDRDVTWVTTPSWSEAPPNGAPVKPSIPSPYDGELDVDVNPTLSVYVYDPDGDAMDVTFYNNETGTSFGTDFVVSGARASVTWSGLSYETPYSWYAVASDGELTNRSETWNFTTGEPQPEKFYANQDINVKNGGITGSYLNTHYSDDSYMEIQEKQSGGKPSNRYSYLEHKWIIPVTGGLQYYEFALEAHHTDNSEGDDFVFAYSLDDASYTDMMLVTKTVDDDSYQYYVLPTSISGNVYIRVKDMDQSQGNINLDSILVNHMYIEGTGTPPPNRAPAKPSNPSPYDTETNVDVNPTLSVYVYDPDGDAMDVTFYNNEGASLGTDFGVASGTRASIELSSLLFETTYFWYADVSDLEYTKTSETWSFTTRADIPVGGIYIWDISFTSAGPNLKSTVTIRLDSDYDSIAEASDALVSGATVTYNLTNQEGDFNIYSDVTDSTGTVTFQWKKAPSGEYVGIVTIVEHSIYTYNDGMNVKTSDIYTH